MKIAQSLRVLKLMPGKRHNVKTDFCPLLNFEWWILERRKPRGVGQGMACIIRHQVRLLRGAEIWNFSRLFACSQSADVDPGFVALHVPMCPAKALVQSYVVPSANYWERRGQHPLPTAHIEDLSQVDPVRHVSRAAVVIA